MTTPFRLIRRKHGFTLVELMVVVVIIGILATMGAQSFTAYLLEGNLNAAKPYLMAIASKMRTQMTQYGTWLGRTSTGADNWATYAGGEQNLENWLGVDLKDAGDFCFVVVKTGKPKFISDSAASDGFEVWAILRNTTYTTADSPGKDQVKVYGTGLVLTCTTADDKLVAGGWIKNTGSEVGGEGRVVVLRYPPPADGVDAKGRNGRDGVYLDWVNGISITDPLL